MREGKIYGNAFHWSFEPGSSQSDPLKPNKQLANN
jgi:hypothetical protein